MPSINLNIIRNKAYNKKLKEEGSKKLADS